MDMYKKQIALKFVNRILRNLGRHEINELSEFKNINKLEITKNDNITIVSDLENEIYKTFGKHECGYYRRSLTCKHLITMLRGMCKNLGYKFLGKRRFDTKRNVTYHIYSIVNSV